MCKMQIGQPAPPFNCAAVVDNRLKEVSLSTYQEAQHWTILLFFPKAWSPVCPTEIIAFSHRLEEFLYTRACAVLFASTDSLDSLRAWNNTDERDGGLGGVHVPLISDCSHRISRAYGVLDEDSGLAQRAMFIIDPQGIVRAISSNDAYVARNVEEVFRLVDALKFKDEFGEGCAANWKKGDPGIDFKKDRVEGPLTIDIKKSWSEWARPKLTRAFSGNSQRSSTPTTPNTERTIAVNGHARIESINGMVPTIAVLASSLHSSAQPSPMAIPPAADYVSARPLSGRMELQLEEAHLKQRLENMNASLMNHKHSQDSGIINE